MTFDMEGGLNGGHIFSLIIHSGSVVLQNNGINFVSAFCQSAVQVHTFRNDNYMQR